MDNNNSNITVKSLIKNILINNSTTEEIKLQLATVKNPLDIAMILFALDVNKINDSLLILLINQYKNILLEQYLSTDILEKKIDLNACDVEDISNECAYNEPNAPIEVYGEASADGFIYIDGRHAMPYEPLTEEKAMKFVFLEKKLLPPQGSKAHIDQRFEYFTDDGESRMCIRRFIIDHNGHVVRFLGETTKPINYNNTLIDDDNGFNTGVLADLLNIKEEN